MKKSADLDEDDADVILDIEVVFGPFLGDPTGDQR